MLSTSPHTQYVPHDAYYDGWHDHYWCEFMYRGTCRTEYRRHLKDHNKLRVERTVRIDRVERARTVKSMLKAVENASAFFPHGAGLQLALRGAATHGKLDIVRYCLEQRVHLDESKWDPNYAAVYEAVCNAVRGGHLDVLHSLVACDNVNLRYMNTGIDYYRAADSWGSIREYRNVIFDDYLITRAAKRGAITGDVTMLQYMIDNGFTGSRKEYRTDDWGPMTGTLRDMVYPIMERIRDTPFIYRVIECLLLACPGTFTDPSFDDCVTIVLEYYVPICTTIRKMRAGRPHEPELDWVVMGYMWHPEIVRRLRQKYKK